MASCCPEAARDLSVVTVVLHCALTGVEVLDQQDEGQQVSWAQGAGTVAAERTDSWSPCAQCLAGQWTRAVPVMETGAWSLPSRNLRLSQLIPRFLEKGRV